MTLPLRYGMPEGREDNHVRLTISRQSSPGIGESCWFSSGAARCARRSHEGNAKELHHVV